MKRLKMILAFALLVVGLSVAGCSRSASSALPSGPPSFTPPPFMPAAGAIHSVRISLGNSELWIDYRLGAVVAQDPIADGQGLTISYGNTFNGWSLYADLVWGQESVAKFTNGKYTLCAFGPSGAYVMSSALAYVHVVIPPQCIGGAKSGGLVTTRLTYSPFNRPVITATRTDPLPGPDQDGVNYAPGRMHGMSIWSQPKGVDGANRLVPNSWVVVVHGGGWQSGSRTQENNAALNFALAGYTVFNVDYRMGPGIRIEDEVADVRSAVRWVQAHEVAYHLTDRGVIYGMSAGGHLATLAALTLPGSQIRGIVSNDGVLEPGAIAGYMPHRARELYSIEEYFTGCSYPPTTAKCRQSWVSISPQYDITKSSPPMYLVNGSEDPVVPSRTVSDFARLLYVRGVRGSVVSVVPRGQHSESNTFDNGPRQAAMLAWVFQRLSR